MYVSLDNNYTQELVSLTAAWKESIKPWGTIVVKLAQSLSSHSTDKGQAWGISLHRQQEVDGEGNMSTVLGLMGFSYTEFGEKRCKLF